MSSMFKIFVGNISFETTEEQLRKVFEPHIEIEDLVIARDEESGKSRGFAFVMTRDPIRGRRAVNQVGKFFIDGRLAYTKEAHGGKKTAGRGGQRGGRRVSHRPRPNRRRGFTAQGEGGGGGGAPRPRPSRGYVGIEDEKPPTPPPANVESESSQQSR